MSGLGTLAAYTGLLSGPSKRESAQQNLATLEHLNQNLERDKKEEMMYQELEAKEYEEISKAASELLERDRQKVNSKAVQMQGDIREAIKGYGSRKKFIENGGLSQLKKYKTDLLYSDEVSSYRDNKQNLERIYSIMLADKGHLVAQRDMNSMLEYQAGKGDKISFSGMKVEVEVPDKHQHWGHKLTPEMILAQGDNQAKIYANFLIDNPEYEGVPYARIQEEILAYTKQNYGGLGSEKQFLQQEIATARAAASNKKTENAGTKTESQDEDYWVNMTNTIKGIGSYVPTTGQNLLSTKDGGYKSLFDIAREANNPEINKIFGGNHSNYKNFFETTQFKTASFLRNLDDSGKTIGNVFNTDYYQPASAIQMPTTYKNALNEGLYGNDFNKESGYVNISFDSNGTYYKGNGSLVDKSDLDGSLSGITSGVTSGDFKVKDYILGWVDENGEMITNLVDKKGKVKDRQEERASKWNNTNARAAIFTVLEQKDNEGKIVYQKHEIDNVASLTSLKNFTGPLSNTSSVTKQVNAYQEDFEKVSAVVAQHEQTILNQFEAANQSQNGFASPDFMAEARSLKTNSGNRDHMLKAFYMAQTHMNNKKNNNADRFTKPGLENSQFIQNKTFTNLVTASPELQTAALNKTEVNDNAFIDMFLNIMNTNEEEGTVAENSLTAHLWKEYYKLLTKKK